MWHVAGCRIIPARVSMHGEGCIAECREIVRRYAGTRISKDEHVNSDMVWLPVKDGVRSKVGQALVDYAKQGQYSWRCVDRSTRVSPNERLIAAVYGLPCRRVLDARIG